MPTIDDSVRLVPRIGTKKAKILEKLRIYTLRDALNTYPRQYEDRSRITPISKIVEPGKYALRAIVGSQPRVTRVRANMTLTQFIIFDSSGSMRVTFFNAPYIASTLREGQECLFYGQVQINNYARTLISPQVEKGDLSRAARIAPIYPLAAGLTQNDMRQVTEAALSAIPENWSDPLPETLRAKYQLVDSSTALHAIHRPAVMEDVAEARRRIIFEDLFLLCCGLQQLKTHRRQETGFCFSLDRLQEFFSVLPFTLTNAQRRAIDEIAADCAAGRPMNRLVQGDVGSGKTIVAAALCVLAVQNGWQAAFMAPTEILAAQHAKTLLPLLAKLGMTGALLTGSLPAAQKRTALSDIEQGKAQVVIGTHALIQKNVVFQRLGAVIADEQHRFGVAQRAALSNKGIKPHTLVMSATPIPRTLALIFYGDLDVSILDETPPGRSPVKTYAVGQDMRQRITAFMDKQIAAGGQVYVVCPLIEENDSSLTSAEQYARSLQKELPRRRIALLHGRMKNAEKETIMRAFAERAYDILVATTVIEVGVDVPNANLMVVENAERFGLSQLHQLRGRVGRGARQSYCIFFGADQGETARKRLKILCKTNDGFAVARADLEQRGPGDFFGRRQHGLPVFRMAEAMNDLSLLQAAEREAAIFLQAHPSLEEYPVLQKQIEQFFDSCNREALN